MTMEDLFFFQGISNFSSTLLSMLEILVVSVFFSLNSHIRKLAYTIRKPTCIRAHRRTVDKCYLQASSELDVHHFMLIQVQRQKTVSKNTKTVSLSPCQAQQPGHVWPKMR